MTATGPRARRPLLASPAEPHSPATRPVMRRVVGLAVIALGVYVARSATRRPAALGEAGVRPAGLLGDGRRPRPSPAHDELPWPYRPPYAERPLTSGRRWSLSDLAAILLLGVAMCALVNLVPGSVVLRAAFALPFLLVGEGYLLMAALFGTELPESSLRLMLAPALSVGSLILVALGLDVVGIGLGARPIADATLILGAIAAGVAACRRRGARFEPPAIKLDRLVRSRWAWSALVAVAVFAALVTALARPLPNGDVAGYTALTSLRSGPSSVTVSVHSAEHQTVTYRLEVMAASGSRSVRTFTLKPGASWSRAIAVLGAPLQSVNVLLYRSPTSAAIYRQTTLRP